MQTNICKRCKIEPTNTGYDFCTPCLNEMDKLYPQISKDKSTKLPLRVYVGLTFIAIMLMLLIIAKLTPPKENINDAADAVHKAVLARLATPKTAEFEKDNQVVKVGEGIYAVWGHVNSQNYFGATLQKKYNGRVLWDSLADKYTVLSVSIEE